MGIQKINDRRFIHQAIKEFDRLGQEVFLATYGFRKSRDFRIRYPANTGRLYDSKAIVGVAYGYAFPDEGPLSAKKFSGGKASVEKLLTDLGFEVVSVDWTHAEVEATVRSYFEMLELERRGERYNKSAYNERLRKLLNNRSKGAVEQKHQNISAVLLELGVAPIRGYKPRGNFQGLLLEVVKEHLGRDVANASLPLVEQSTTHAQAAPGASPTLAALADPPALQKAPPPLMRRTRVTRQVNYAIVEERNRLLGSNGEEWALQFERIRLHAAGRGDLAQRIEWVSKTKGDGAGYDILSFDVSGMPRYIEVKTTNRGPDAPFLISRNEKAFSEENPLQFYIYRIFHFNTRPRVFILPGSLSNLTLEPVAYSVSLSPATVA
ncbi:Protein NO VEIN C-terminal domain-containing protein [Cupriavidus sp. H19C3]|uniref:DUF3883 domain-containing protein n=1 Tax=Cupriavidus sp. H19C3 TaxID=3241603 RepID=UPI003BF8C029